MRVIFPLTQTLSLGERAYLYLSHWVKIYFSLSLWERAGVRAHARSTPSWANSSVSIATSLPVALRSEPSHFMGQAR